jgi:hypothetical protein
MDMPHGINMKIQTQIFEKSRSVMFNDDILEKKLSPLFKKCLWIKSTFRKVTKWL